MKNYKFNIRSFVLIIVVLLFSSCLSEEEKYEIAKKKCNDKEYIDELFHIGFKGYSYQEINEINVKIFGTQDKTFKVKVPEKIYGTEREVTIHLEKVSLKDSILLVFPNKEEYLLTDFKYDIEAVVRGISTSSAKFVCSRKEVKINNIVKKNWRGLFVKKNSVILTSKHKSGKEKHIIIAKDSGECEQLHILYYKNGLVKEKGCQGHFNSFNVPVNTWFYYDSLGILSHKEFYSYHKDNGWKKTVFFDKYYNIIEKKTVGYDPDFGELDSIWEWEILDKKGELIKIK